MAQTLHCTLNDASGGYGRQLVMVQDAKEIQEQETAKADSDQKTDKDMWLKIADVLNDFGHSTQCDFIRNQMKPEILKGLSEPVSAGESGS